MLKRLWFMAVQSVRSFAADDCLSLAAVVAFYAALSLAPVLAISLTVLDKVAGEDLNAKQQIMEQVYRLAGPPGARAVQDILDHAGTGRGRGLAAVVGVVTLLFGATAVFAALQAAMNRIWCVEPVPGRQLSAWIRKRLLSLGMLLALAALLLASLVMSLVINLAADSMSGLLPGSQGLWKLAGFLSGLLIFGLLFAIIFKVLPDANVAWRDVWIGAAVTAVLFALGRAMIGLYLRHSEVGSAYGTAGSLVVLLLWVHYSSMIMSLGAECTEVSAGMSGRGSSPAAHAVINRSKRPEGILRPHEEDQCEGKPASV